MSLDRIKRLLTQHEGCRTRMYKCSAGFNTIGVGHNLDANGLTLRAVDLILEDDILAVFSDLDKNLPGWREHDEVRRAALVDLCFNMGWPTLSQFKATLASFQKRDYARAADGLVASKWYGQVGARGPRVVRMVRDGLWPDGAA